MPNSTGTIPANGSWVTIATTSQDRLVLSPVPGATYDVDCPVGTSAARGITVPMEVFADGNTARVRANGAAVNYTLLDVEDAALLTAEQAQSLRGLAATDLRSFRRSALSRAIDQGFGTVTFTRTGGTSQGSFVDCYGSMRFLPSSATNVPRINGARWVFNEFTDTENFVTGWFMGSGPTTTPTRLSMKSPNHDRPSVFSFSRPSGNSDMVIFGSRAYRPGKWGTAVEVFGDGVTQYTLRIENSATLANGAERAVVPPAGEWRTLFVVYDIPDTSNHRVKLTCTTAGAATIIACDPRMCQIDGDPNACPPEYVPRGVSTALLPVAAYSGDLGVGCDGGRYFDTYNPLSISGNYLVRAATPTSINPATISMAVAGSDDDNQLRSSRNVGASEWTSNGSVTVNGTPVDCTLLGKNSLYKIQQSAGNEAHYRYQQWVAGSAVTTSNRVMYAMCVMRAGDAGCPFVYLSISQRDGTYKHAYGHATTGAVSDVSTGAFAFTFKRGGEWHLVLITTSGTSGSSLPTLRVGVTQTSGAQTLQGTAGNGNYVGAIQSGEGLPVAYLGDTSTSAGLSRTAELLQLEAPDMPAVGFTIAGEFATSYPTNCPYIDGWKWLMYRQTSLDDRGGFGVRPDSFGGFVSGRGGEPFFDFYPNIANSGNSFWTGIHISTGRTTTIPWIAQALEFYRWRWSLATTSVQARGSNQSGAVGSWVASETGNDNPNSDICAWPPASTRVFTIGRPDSATKQRGEVYVRNLAWKPRADLAADMLAA